MKTTDTLITSLVAILIFTLPVSYAVAASPGTNNENNSVKTSILDSYLQRCVEVLHSKGYSSDAIKAECTCELDYIDQHFDIFEQMLEGSTADNQQQINDFKKLLLQCKVKPDTR